MQGQGVAQERAYPPHLSPHELIVTKQRGQVDGREESYARKKLAENKAREEHPF